MSKGAINSQISSSEAEIFRILGNVRLEFLRFVFSFEFFKWFQEQNIFFDFFAVFFSLSEIDSGNKYSGATYVIFVATDTDN